MTKKARSRLASSRARHDSVAPAVRRGAPPVRSGEWRDPSTERDDPSAPALTPPTYPRPPPFEGTRLLDKAEVCAIVNKSYQYIWTLMRRGAFPRSPLVGTRPMWLSSEITQWISELPVVRLKGDGQDA